MDNIIVMMMMMIVDTKYPTGMITTMDGTKVTIKLFKIMEWDMF